MRICIHWRIQGGEGGKGCKRGGGGGGVQAGGGGEGVQACIKSHLRFFFFFVSDLSAKATF